MTSKLISPEGSGPAIVGAPRSPRLRSPTLPRNATVPGMTQRFFHWALVAIAVGFTVFFCTVVMPPVLESGDILGAFAAGFVNPYASGYSADVIACWLILAVWVLHEARAEGVKGGWFCVLLGVVPGVAVGLAAYLIVRARQRTQAVR